MVSRTKAKKVVKQSRLLLMVWFSIDAIYSIIFMAYGYAYFVGFFLFDIALMYSVFQEKVKFKVIGFWVNALSLLLGVILISVGGFYSGWQIFSLFGSILSVYLFWRHCDAAKTLVKKRAKRKAETDCNRGESESEVESVVGKQMDEKIQLETFSQPVSQVSLVEQHRITKGAEKLKDHEAVGKE